MAAASARMDPPVSAGPSPSWRSRRSRALSSSRVVTQALTGRLEGLGESGRVHGHGDLGCEVGQDTEVFVAELVLAGAGGAPADGRPWFRDGRAG